MRHRFLICVRKESLLLVAANGMVNESLLPIVGRAPP
jgi:hypothetical protein